jgi:hypothetical protein
VELLEPSVARGEDRERGVTEVAADREAEGAEVGGAEEGRGIGGGASGEAEAADVGGARCASKARQREEQVET